MRAEDLEPSPASVLLAELRSRASERAASASACANAADADASHAGPHRGDLGAAPIPEHLSDCAESEDAPGNPTPHHSWLAMLAAEDRAAAPFPPQGTLLDDPALYDPYALRDALPPPGGHGAGGVARGVFSHLRRSHTVPPRAEAPFDAAAAASYHHHHHHHHHRAYARATSDAAASHEFFVPLSAASPPPPPRPPPRSLVDRLKSSVAEDPDAVPPGAAAPPHPVGRGARLPGAASIRRSRSSPAATSEYSDTEPLRRGGEALGFGFGAFGSGAPPPPPHSAPTHGAPHPGPPGPPPGPPGGSPSTPLYPPSGGYEMTVARTDAERLAAHRAARAQLSDPRPFGFLGVTRPAWTTRWEAWLDDAQSGARVFLGSFDAKESAARAHDAARIKLYGMPPECGALNFDASEYASTLAEMTECSFEDFVRALVRHGYGGERRLSRFRGVHAGAEGKWEARVEDE